MSKWEQDPTDRVHTPAPSRAALANQERLRAIVQAQRAEQALRDADEAAPIIEARESDMARARWSNPANRNDHVIRIDGPS